MDGFRAAVQVIPGRPIAIIPVPYRHSRVSGNPDGTATDRLTTRLAFLDSRLRGNDGKRLREGR